MKELGSVRLFTVKEISQNLGIHTFTIRMYIRQRKLKARKVGNTYFVTEDNLKEFFDGAKTIPNENSLRIF